jgi:hypothetical protein
MTIGKINLLIKQIKYIKVVGLKYLDLQSAADKMDKDFSNYTYFIRLF